jgi:hypothetical protein
LTLLYSLDPQFGQASLTVCGVPSGLPISNGLSMRIGFAASEGEAPAFAPP